MSFVQAYRSVSNCIVAIAAKFSFVQEDFPEIIGTGFLISSQGIVCTNRHVVDALDDLPRPEGHEGIPAQVLVYHEVTVKGKTYLAWAPLEIFATGHATLIGDPTKYKGPNPPDVSFILLPLSDTPKIAVATTDIEEGEDVAFAGFPMGTALLKLPGHLNQITPTLHSGIVSAILPDRLDQNPFGFWINTNTQGGASGSPVFREDGQLVGMVSHVALDKFEFGGENEHGYTAYLVPTALTGCVSRQIIAEVLPLVEGEAEKITGREKWEDAIKKAKIIPTESGRAVMEPWHPNAPH
ncbi:MAG TPA: serine protease [Thermoanaerobaculia bacterium]|nr:serine protease [Thermoanaerobaculia bacterium]